MNCELSYKVDIAVAFTDEQAEFIARAIKTGEKPYEAGEDGVWGKFLRMRAFIEDKTIPLDITISDMDRIILKSLEPYALYNYSDEKVREQATELFYGLTKITELAIDTCYNLNELQQAKPGAD
jgi:hypothetical protein